MTKLDINITHGTGQKRIGGVKFHHGESEKSRLDRLDSISLMGGFKIVSFSYNKNTKWPFILVNVHNFDNLEYPHMNVNVLTSSFQQCSGSGYILAPE